VLASDYQESKNLNSPSLDILPNTNARGFRFQVVDGPALTWLVPEERQCVVQRQRLLVAASATTRIRDVRFVREGDTIGVDRRGPAGLYSVTWNTRGLKKGPHKVEARVTTRDGKVALESRTLRKC
jgi:hypothetical protein